MVFIGPLLQIAVLRPALPHHQRLDFRSGQCRLDAGAELLLDPLGLLRIFAVHGQKHGPLIPTDILLVVQPENQIADRIPYIPGPVIRSGQNFHGLLVESCDLENAVPAVDGDLDTGIHVQINDAIYQQVAADIAETRQQQ